MVALTYVKKFFRPLFFCVGIFLIYTLLNKIGIHEIWEILNNIGLKIIVVLVFPVCWYLVQTYAWHLVLEETGKHINFWDLFLIKLIGETVNTSTPVGFMGGDPIRISMLGKKMPGSLSTASVVLDRTIHTLATVILLFITFLLAWQELDLPPAWKNFFPIVILILILFTLWVIHHQRKGLFGKIHRFLGKLKIKHKKLDAWEKHIIELDERMSKFYQHDKKRFWQVLTIHIFGRMGGVFEIMLIGYFLHIPIGFEGSFFLASLAILVNIIFVFIPGTMGVMEGAYGALCLLLNLPLAAGVAIQIMRRLRSVFWIFVGYTLVLVLKKGASRHA
jgi:glycosyltransferase 2 family protein